MDFYCVETGIKSKVENPLWLLVKYNRWHRKVKIEPGSTCRFTRDPTYHCILSRGFLSVLHGVEESLYKTCKRHMGIICV